VTGIAAVLAAAGGASGVSGTVVPSPTPVWTSIYGFDSGATNVQTISGITSPISISAALSGGGTLFYTQNGAIKPYSGAFTVNAGDTLGWTVVFVTGGSVSGNITVTNISNGSATLAAIPYAVSS
jgi:hypothetical protein